MKCTLPFEWSPLLSFFFLFRPLNSPVALLTVSILLATLDMQCTWCMALLGASGVRWHTVWLSKQMQRFFWLAGIEENSACREL